MILNVQIKQPTKRAITTRALIDSGATGSFIDRKFVRLHQMSTTPIRNPIRVVNSDKSVNSIGLITEYVKVEL
ncbi:hypothetical protein BDN72DRAFT_769131, partial [Pluteus cervinus]